MLLTFPKQTGVVSFKSTSQRDDRTGQLATLLASTNEIKPDQVAELMTDGRSSSQLEQMSKQLKQFTDRLISHILRKTDELKAKEDFCFLKQLLEDNKGNLSLDMTSEGRKSEYTIKLITADQIEVRASVGKNTNNPISIHKTLTLDDFINDETEYKYYLKDVIKYMTGINRVSV